MSNACLVGGYVKAAGSLPSFPVRSQAPVEVEDELVASEGLDLSSDSSDSESEEEPAPLPPPAKKSKGSTSAHHRQSGFDAF